MTQGEFNKLSKEEQRHLSSEFRKTVHDGEIVFLNDKNAKSLTPQEAKEQLLKQRDELLASLGFQIPNENKNDASNDYSRHEGLRKINMDEKMKSGIIGFAVGDALGVPVEFLNRGLLQKHPLKEMIGYGSHGVPEGTWSDDTSLTIAAMDSITENDGIDFEDIMYRFTEWVDYAKYTATDELFDIGISTRKAILNFKKGEKATDCGTKGINENGNGSLMRMLPFVYYLKTSNFSEEEKTMLINQASSLTHAHEISRLGCKIYADYVDLLLDGVDKVKALELLKKVDYSKYYSADSIKAYKRILKDDLNSLDINQIKSSGFVVDSLEASLWCTLKNKNYEDAVVTAVNLGDDTDTIGAITGSLNGIIYGENNIPKRWLDKLKKKEYLEELSTEFVNTIKHEKIKKTL